MRPPVLPSGNILQRLDHGLPYLASMRPPVLPSGNVASITSARASRTSGFNEAAGFTQRKPVAFAGVALVWLRFNEAAGFTQRKRRVTGSVRRALAAASMRPPVLPSGNRRIRG